MPALLITSLYNLPRTANQSIASPLGKQYYFALPYLFRYSVWGRLRSRLTGMGTFIAMLQTEIKITRLACYLE